MNNQVEFEISISEEEKKKIFEYLDAHDTVILCKTSEGNSLEVNGYSFSKLVFNLNSVALKKNEVFEVNFELDSKKYILRSIIKELSGSSVLLSSENLQFAFLQRRENFRVNILGSSRVDMHITRFNDTLRNWKASVVNLSLGGAQIELQTVDAQVLIGDEIEGEFLADGFKPFTVTATVRRVNSQTVFGIEFKGLSGLYLGFMNQIVMKMAREESKFQ